MSGRGNNNKVGGSKRGRSSFGFSNGLGKKKRSPGSVSEDTTSKGQPTSSSSGDLDASSKKSSWEARDNKRIHFDVLGRRVKGGTRNVLMSRSKAYAKRSHSILAEMVAAKKSNAFVDRRFGELGDGSSALDEESKALMRFKKERLRQLKVAKRSQRFSLNDDAGNSGSGSLGAQIQLTHGGRAIGFDNDDNDGEFSGRAFGPLDDDDEDDFDMSEVHFRGGEDDNNMGDSRRSLHSSRPAWMNSEADGEEGQQEKREGYHADGTRMTHKEIMEEVIAKSKAAKADRQREKADMDSLLSRLDSQAGVVQKLLGKRNRDMDDMSRKKKMIGGSVEVDGVALGDKAAKLLASALASVGEEEQEVEDDDGYRALLTTLASQPRGAIARNREKTEEEVAEEEAERLKELESLRIARMKTSGTGGGGGGGGDDGPEGTSDQARSSLGVSSSSIARGSGRHGEGGGDDLGLDDADTKGLTWRQRRVQSSKVNVWDFAKGLKDKEDEEEEHEIEDKDEDSDDSDDDVEEDDEEDDDDEDEEAWKDEEEEKVAVPPSVSVPKTTFKASSKSVKDEDNDNTESSVSLIETMPFVFQCPKDRSDLANLFKKYCNDFTTASELLRRIRALFSVALDAHNRGKLASLYRALLDDIISHGNSALKLDLWRIEASAECLFSMSQENALKGSEIAGSVWRDFAASVAKRVTNELSVAHALPSTDASLVPLPHRAWFTGGEIVAMKVASGRVLPASDFRHPVLLTLELVAAQVLTQCPVSSEMDICRGLLVASSLCETAMAKGRRYAPEVVSFLSSTLSLFALSSVPAASKESSLPFSIPNVILPTFRPFQKLMEANPIFDLLRSAASSEIKTIVHGVPFSITKSSKGLSRDLLSYYALCGALRLAELVTSSLIPAEFVKNPRSNLHDAGISPHGNAAKTIMSARGSGGSVFPITSGTDVPVPCAPEILDPIINLIAALLALIPKSSSVRIRSQLSETLSFIVKARDAVAVNRPPLRFLDSSGPAPAIRMFTPLFEDVNGPDPRKRGLVENDADADAVAKAEVRMLQKQVKREKRGAVRELKLDRDFIARAQDAQLRSRDAERVQKGKEVMRELETLQADFNKQVRMSKSRPLSASSGGKAVAAVTAEKSAFKVAKSVGGFNKVGKTKADRLARKGKMQTKD